MAMQWLDFEDNPELVQRMRELINVMNITGMQNIAEQLERQLVRGQEEEEKELMFTHQPPKSHPLLTKKGKSDKELHILDIHPEEVARQLTIMEHNLFKKIKPWEFLNQRWSKYDKLEKAPGIMAITKRFNMVSKWVASLIVLAKDKKERVLVLNRLIEIAEVQHLLVNYNWAYYS
jgi:son of sevenless-like protein